MTMSNGVPGGFHTTLLSNGVEIPTVGCGCAFGNWTGTTEFQGFLPENAWRATHLALAAGARHFDMALVYGTHRAVGSVLGQKLMSGEIERKDVFLTTKVAHPSAPPHVALSPLSTLEWTLDDIESRVERQIETSFQEVGVGYFDLLLIHWPGEFGSTNEQINREMRLRIWRVFERYYKRKQARAIGVCNFSKKHIAQLIDDGCTIVPMVNQIEVHPYCFDVELISFCQSKGIVVTAYAPFASGSFGLLTDPSISNIATTVKRTVGQVILRWLSQKGMIVLPKSNNSKRMEENQNIFDFHLSSDQVTEIDGLCDPLNMKRSCPSPDLIA